MNSYFHRDIPLIRESAAYEVENLGRRVGLFLDLMEQVGTTRADMVVAAGLRNPVILANALIRNDRLWTPQKS